MFILLTSPLESAEATTWEPEPAPRTLTPEQQVFYPDLETYTPPRKRAPLLVVLTSRISWQNISAEFAKNANLKSYATAGLVGTVAGADSPCVSQAVLTIQNGTAPPRLTPCPQTKIAGDKIKSIPGFIQSDTPREQADPTSRGQLRGILKAFGLKSQAIGPQAGLLLADKQGKVENYRPLPTTPLQLQSQVKSAIKHSSLTVVDLTGIKKPATALTMLEGALASLSPETALISVSLGLSSSQNAAPHLLTYSPIDATGLVSSPTTNIPGLVTLEDVNAQILYQLQLPSRAQNTGKAFKASNIPGKEQTLINLSGTSSHQAKLNLKQRLNYLDQQFYRSVSAGDANCWFYLFWSLGLLVTVLGFVFTQRESRKHHVKVNNALSFTGFFTALLVPASYCLFYLAKLTLTSAFLSAIAIISLTSLGLTALLFLFIVATRETFNLKGSAVAQTAGLGVSILTGGMLWWASQNPEYTLIGTPFGYSILHGPWLIKLSAEALGLLLSCWGTAIACLLTLITPLRRVFLQNRRSQAASLILYLAALSALIYCCTTLQALLTALLFLIPLIVALIFLSRPTVLLPQQIVSKTRLRLISLASVTVVIAMFGVASVGVIGVSPDAAPSKIKSLPTSTKTPVAVIFTSGLTWMDLLAASPKNRESFVTLNSGALFSLAPYPLKGMACPQDAWLALSAGKSPSKFSLAGRNLCIVPESLGHNQRVKLWKYYQRAAKKSSLSARLGMFAAQLSENQVSVGAIGNSAGLALADKEGIVRGEVKDITPTQKGYSRAVQKMVSTHALTLIDVQSTPLNRNPNRQNQEVLAQRGEIFSFLNPSSGTDTPQQSEVWDPIWLLEHGGSLSGNSLQARAIVPDQKASSVTSPDRNELRQSEMNPQENPTPASSPGIFGDSDNKFQSGNLHISSLSTLLIPDQGKNQEYVAKTRRANVQLFPNVSTFEALRGMQPARISVDQQDAQLKALQDTLTALPEGTRALVVSTSPDSAKQKLQAGLIYGEGVPAGIAYSSSTHQVGIVQNADLSATVLNWLGASNYKLSTSGAPLKVSAQAGKSLGERIERLAGYGERADASYSRLGIPPSSYVLFAADALLVLGLLLQRIPRICFSQQRSYLLSKVAYLGRFVCLTIAALPATCLMAAMFPWWEADSPSRTFTHLSLLAAGLLSLAACTGPWRRRPIGPALVVGLFSVFVICLDVAWGSHISMDSPFGSFSLLGARFFGFGNVYYSVCAIWTLLLCACLTPLANHLVSGKHTLAHWQIWLSNLLISVLAFAFMAIDGMPSFGADFGGPISFLPGFLVLLLLINGKRVNIKRLLIALMVAGTASGGIALADWLRPAAQRTHLGNFVQSILNGDLLEILTRKLLANLGSWGFTTYVWSLLCCLLVFALVLRPALEKQIYPYNLVGSWDLSLPLEESTNQESKQNSPISWRQRVKSQAQKLVLIISSSGSYLRPRLGELPLTTRESGLRLGLVAIAVNQFFAYLLNDSGTQLPAIGLLLTALAYCSAVFAQISESLSKGTR
ncbi:hypothetical protein [Varibaculum vaginae]|uniref:hypothetical protein n=1 Tax=Varibaculum vaginae TaxID=2364797 RepID=UPI0011C4965B|nr:hypothetical protein [Varibaculum vaginae]